MKRVSGLKRDLSSFVFQKSGMTPWSKGYSSFKWKQISSELERADFNSKSLRTGYGFRLDERIVEYPWFFSRLPAGAGKLLDAGSTLNYAEILCHPSLKSKQLFITTLAPEEHCYWHQGISYVFDDLRDTCFRDRYFDWIASISTVEHIGMDNTMIYTTDDTKKEADKFSFLNALREYDRLLKPGGTLFLTLPFGKHDNYRWLQVFDGAMIDKAIAVFDGSSVIENLFKYTASGWIPASRVDCVDARYFDVHTYDGPNELQTAASGAIICLEITKPK